MRGNSWNGPVGCGARMLSGSQVSGKKTHAELCRWTGVSLTRNTDNHTVPSAGTRAGHHPYKRHPQLPTTTGPPANGSNADPEVSGRP